MRWTILILTLVASLASVSLGARRTSENAAARAALSRTLPEVRFTNITLQDAFDFLRDVSGANLHVNWRALEAIGIGKDTTINVRLRSVPLRSVLNLVCSEAGAGVGAALTFYVEDGVIEITTRELADQRMITIVYPVEDLVMDIPDYDNAPDFSLTSTVSNSRSGSSYATGTRGSYQSRTQTGGEKSTSKAERGQQLVQLIIDTVRPDVWRENGGPAAIRYFNGQLIVTAPRSVHEMIGGPID